MQAAPRALTTSGADGSRGEGCLKNGSLNDGEFRCASSWPSSAVHLGRVGAPAAARSVCT